MDNKRLLTETQLYEAYKRGMDKVKPDKSINGDIILMTMQGEGLLEVQSAVISALAASVSEEARLTPIEAIRAMYPDSKEKPPYRDLIKEERNLINAQISKLAAIYEAKRIKEGK